MDSNVILPHNHAAPIQKCPHLFTTANFEKLRKRVVSRKSSSWKCADCDVAQDCWACASCARIGCGRYNAGHALEHYHKTQHPVSVQLATGMPYCYACDEYAFHDNRHGDLSLLRTSLAECRDRQFTESVTRSGALLRPSSSGVKRRRTGDANGQDVDRPLAASLDLDKLLEAYPFLQFDSSGGPLLASRKEEREMAAQAQASTSPPGASHRTASRGSVQRKRQHRGRKQTAARARKFQKVRATSRKHVSPSQRKRETAVGSGHLSGGAGFVGLRNLGNTCFINSVVQCLSSLPMFRSLFLSLPDGAAAELGPASLEVTGQRGRVRRNRIPPAPVSLGMELRKLLRAMWYRDVPVNGSATVLRRGKAAISPDDFFHAVWRALPPFHGYHQQDAHEFLRLLLERLHHEIEVGRKMLLDRVESENCGETGRRSAQGSGTHSDDKREQRADTMEMDQDKRQDSDISLCALSESNYNAPCGKASGSIHDSIHDSFHSLTDLRDEPVSVADAARVTVSSASRGENLHCAELHANVESNSLSPLDIFQGMLMNDVTCLRCGQMSSKRDPFSDLSLDLPHSADHTASIRDNNRDTAKGSSSLYSPSTPLLPSATLAPSFASLQTTPVGAPASSLPDLGSSCTLEDCLLRFTRAEQLTATDKYICSKCRQKETALKKLTIDSLPPVLSIHIKRFRWNPPLMTKIASFVQFPLSLDVSPYCSDNVSKCKTYALHAVVCHHGNVAGSGHYTAMCRVRGVWCRFDDQSVSVCTEEEVLATQAYLLLYLRGDLVDDIKEGSA